MDYLLLGRVAKVAALLGFVLPWVTVSCSGNELLTATGWQLMIGDPQPVGIAASSEQPEMDPVATAIAAFAVLAIALLASFLTKGRVAAGLLIAGGLGGAGLSYYTVDQAVPALMRSMQEAEAEQRRDSPETAGEALDALAEAITGERSESPTRTSDAVGGLIQVEEEEGYWLTLVASLIAAVLGLLSIAATPRQTNTAPPAS